MPENMFGMVAVVTACAVVLLMGAVRKKMEWLLNFLMRSILGTLAIYFINSILEGAGVSLGVGINPVTVLTSGILGFPGIAAIYGIGFYKFL